jgi:hypothetical protein
MTRLDENYGSGRLQSRSHTEKIQARADAYTRQMDRLRALLGEDGPLHLLDYRATASERASLHYFEQQLPEQDKLSEDVRAQVMKVLRADLEAQILRRQERGFAIAHWSPLEMQQPGAMARATARTNYRELQGMQAASERLLGQLKPLLSPRQFAVYANMENAKIASQRQFVLGLLADAGLDESDIAKTDASIPQTHNPVAGQLIFALKIEVNGISTEISDMSVESGAVAEVQLADELSMELLPTLHVDGYLDVKTKFFEGTGPHRRAVSFGGNSGHAFRLRDSTMRDAYVTRTVVEGTRGYAVIVRMTNIRHPVLDSAPSEL